MDTKNEELTVEVQLPGGFWENDIATLMSTSYGVVVSGVDGHAFTLTSNAQMLRLILELQKMQRHKQRMGWHTEGKDE